MKIAVISDTHDHIENVERAVEEIGRLGAAALFHCGDLCSPFMIERLAGFRGPVHIVFGNNEGDRLAIGAASAKFANIALHGEYGFVETENGLVAFTHRPEFARGFACTGTYAAVLYGHTHRYRAERVGASLLANPGDLIGLYEPAGYIIVDLATGDISRRAVT